MFKVKYAPVKSVPISKAYYDDVALNVYVVEGSGKISGFMNYDRFWFDLFKNGEIHYIEILTIGFNDAAKWFMNPTLKPPAKVVNASAKIIPNKEVIETSVETNKNKDCVHFFVEGATAKKHLRITSNVILDVAENNLLCGLWVFDIETDMLKENEKTVHPQEKIETSQLHQFAEIDPHRCPRCGAKAGYDNQICSHLPAAGNEGKMTCTKCGFAALFINEKDISTHYCKHCNSVFYNKLDKWLKKPETETKQKVIREYGKHKFIKIVPTLCPRCGAATKYDRHVVGVHDTEFVCSHIIDARNEFVKREGEPENEGKMSCTKCGFVVLFVNEMGISTHYCKHCDSVFYNMFGNWEMATGKVSNQNAQKQKSL